MQENNFEKQVQQKMDELSMSPSTEVWQKLSVSIAKDKKDRRFFAIIILLFLLFSTTLYFIFNNPSNSEAQNASLKENISGKTKSSSNPAIKNKANEIVDDTINTENSAKNLSAIEAQHQSVPVTQSEKADVATNSIVAENVSSFSTGNNQSDETNIKTAAADKVENAVYKTKQRVVVTVSENTPGDLVDENFGTIDSGKLNETAYRNAKKVADPLIDFATNYLPHDIAGMVTTISMQQLSDSFVQLVTTANKKELVIKEKIALIKGKGWKLGLNFSFGASTTQAGLLGIIGPGSGDGSKALRDQLQNSTGGGVTPGSPVVYYPSRVKTGAGILVGAFVQKSISTRSAIALGLNFKMLTSSMQTGARVDSAGFYTGNNFASANFYYRNGSQQNFNNHFYFIELPVSIKLQLNKQKKVPVYLNTGINLARLINSNALQFDVTSGTYYRDNALLNKTQLNVALGVLFSLNAKSKNPLLIGPDMQYSFSKMANAGLYKSRHYSFIGLTLQKSIGKK